MAKFLYRLASHNEMGPLAKAFLTNMSWSFLGGIISAILLLLSNVLAGRFLGPTEYGKFNLIASLSQILFVFLIFSMDRTSLRFISKEKTRAGKARMLSSALYSTLLNGAVIALVYLLFYRYVASFFNVESELILFALVYALAFGFRQLFNGFIRGLDNFKFQTLMRIAESLVIVFSLTALLFFLPNRTYWIYLFSLIGGYVFFIVFSLPSIKSYLTFFNWDSFKQQFSFAKLYFLGILFGVFFSSLDKIAVAKYMSLYELGIYGAYYSAAINLTSQFSAIWGNAFSTIFSQNLDKSRLILKKIESLAALFFLPLLLVVMAFTAVIIWLLGESYPLSFWYVFLFSVLAMSSMLNSMTALSTSLYSVGCVRRALILGNLGSLFFIGLFFFLLLWTDASVPLIVGLLIAYNLTNMLMCRYVLAKEGAYDH